MKILPLISATILVAVPIWTYFLVRHTSIDPILSASLIWLLVLCGIAPMLIWIIAHLHADNG